MVSQSWLHSLWPVKKHRVANDAVPRVTMLSFEAASSMAKLVHLWHSLADKHVAKLREEIVNSAGVRNLVSEDEEYIARLICAEMSENVVHVARAISQLSVKCSDPALRSFDRSFINLVTDGGGTTDVYGWQLSWKKMGRKVKKMERFVEMSNNLYRAIVTLTDLEQALKRMNDGNHITDGTTLAKHEKKVAWMQREVRRLKENSLWGRTYDYTVLQLVRCLFTVYAKIRDVFGLEDDARFMNSNNGPPGHSAIFMQSSVHPSENRIASISSSAPGKFVSLSGPLTRGNNTTSDFQLGQLGSSLTKSSSVSGEYNGTRFYSGPLVRPMTQMTCREKTIASRFWPFRIKSHDTNGNFARQKSKGVTMSGPFTGGIMGGINSPIIEGCYKKSSDASDGTLIKSRAHNDVSFGDNFSAASRSKLLNPPPETLGASALALHYANLIVFIEKLVAYPHLIGNDARNDLYDMLPASIRSSLRKKLKLPSTNTNLTSSPNDDDTTLAGEHKKVLLEILQWLAPLAHNMIRWQSSRSIEHQSFVSKTHVLLVQTLYFANQDQTDAAITDVLVRLNYAWRFARETNAKLQGQIELQTRN